MTSRISRSKRRPFELGARVGGVLGGGDAIALAAQKARQQVADAAVVVHQQEMRRIVRKNGGVELAGRHASSVSRASAGAVGARNEPQQAVALFGVDHRGQKVTGGVMRAGAERRTARA